MILSRGRKYLFVHIPKTGGTAMALALEARAMKDDVLIGDTPKARRRRRRLRGIATVGRLWKHSTLTDIDGWLSPADLDGLFVFTMVRNPWDRMVSYYHWLREQAFEHPAVALSRTLDFAGFLRHPQIAASVSAAPYGSYVTDAQGRERCGAFVRLEHLDEDLRPVTGHLGFRPELPRANPSARAPDYRSYYDDALAEQVASLCRPDIDRFGYTFDAAPFPGLHRS